MYSNEKKFGLMMSAAFGGIAVYYTFHLNLRFSIISICFCSFLLILTFKAPRALKGPVHLWLKFGEFIQKITTPIVLSLLFVSVFIPIGFLRKILTKENMNLKFEKNAQTYWKTEPENPQSSFRTQF